MKAILFDLFETLVSHFDPGWTPPARTTAARLGVAPQFHRERWPGFDRRWQEGRFASYGDALRAFCAAANVRPDPGALRELEEEYVAYAARTAFAPADPAIVAMLQSLHASGVSLAVVTNASDLDIAPWPHHELAKHFDLFVGSHDVRLLKPDPRIYALACERLSVEPKDGVFVGDGGSDELRGAREAGLEPLWFTWFLDRWPEGVRPNGFAGDDWRQRPERHEAPFRRVRRPEDLLAALLARRAT